MRVIIFSLFIISHFGYTQPQSVNASKCPSFPWGGGDINNYSIYSNYSSGNLLSTSTRINPALLGQTNRFEIGFNKTPKFRDWHTLLRLPTVGLKLIYVDYEAIGTSLQIMPAINLNVFRLGITSSNFLKFNISLASGLVYNSKTYNEKVFPDNILVGSHFNLGFNIHPYIEFKLFRSLNFTSGVFITHSSNGGTTLPNYGVNNFGYSVGLKYNYVQFKQIKTNQNKSNKITTFQSKMTKYVTANTAPKMIVNNGDRFWTLSISSGNYYQISPVFYIIGSFDFFHDTALREHQKLYNHPKTDINKIGISFGPELRLGKLGIQAQIGHYLYHPYQYSGRNIYQRYGFRYYLNHLIINGTVKAHAESSDFLEIGAGYTF